LETEPVPEEEEQEDTPATEPDPEPAIDDVVTEPVPEREDKQSAFENFLATEHGNELTRYGTIV